MRKIENTREIQECLLQILLYFQSFCQAHGLRFFLSNGTLLGAVKYQGFIPWDDDVDLLMPREDYQRMMELWEENDRYDLLAHQRDENWRVPYAKLSDRRTVMQETTADFGLPGGLAIDVFPLDPWVGGEKQAKLQARRCSLLRRCCSASLEQSFFTPKTGAQKGILYLIWRFSRGMGWKWWYNRISAQTRRGARADHPAWLGSVAWALYGWREVVPAEVFDSAVPVTFEGHSFPAPVGYDRYLHSLYGDYHQDPPEDQQKTHHSIAVWWKDE